MNVYMFKACKDISKS